MKELMLPDDRMMGAHFPVRLSRRPLLPEEGSYVLVVQ